MAYLHRGNFEREKCSSLLPYIHGTFLSYNVCEFFFLVYMYSCIDYIAIRDTPFELHVFWPSDAKSHIKLMLSESISMSLKTGPGLNTMMILNMPQETSNIPM